MQKNLKLEVFVNEILSMASANGSVTVSKNDRW